MKVRLSTVLVGTLLSLAAVLTAATGAPATTRYMVTTNRLHPGSQNDWEKLYVDSVIPALKKAGIRSLLTTVVLFGPRPAYITIRPLENFGELDGPGPFVRAGLPEKQVAAINAARDKALASEDRYVVNVVSDLVVPSAPGSWSVRSRIRA